MLKKVVQSIMILAIMIFLPGCANDATVNDESQNLVKASAAKVPVVVTFNPMKEFVKAIGKDKVEITTMIPNGMVPHNFRPKEEDLNNLSTAKLFVYNGMGMDEWVDKALKDVNNKDLIVVEASKGVKSIKNPESKELENYGSYDPYTWLSLKNAQMISKNIKDALVKIDPVNRNYYEKNYDNFFTDLDNLYTEYKHRFLEVNKKVVFTGHPVFAYLCREFGLKQESMENFTKGSNPSKQEINKLYKFLKNNSIKVVFLENGASIDIVNTLKEDLEVEVETTYCMEKMDPDKSYVDSMRINLDNIYKSLAE